MKSFHTQYRAAVWLTPSCQRRTATSALKQRQQFCNISEIMVLCLCSHSAEEPGQNANGEHHSSLIVFPRANSPFLTWKVTGHSADPIQNLNPNCAANCVKEWVTLQSKHITLILILDKQLYRHGKVIIGII
jgi:hypothetical protein